MTCHVCKALIASGSRFCSICGSSTEPVAVAVTGGASRAESLLAEANLFRLRSQWTEAEKRCVDVMRIDANNVHAHTLLGDIYRDQGKVDEAQQWYQMAIDLEPDNRPLQAKIREVSRGKIPRPPAIPKAPATPKPAVSSALGTQNLMGLSPTHWFRVIWVFCGLFVVAVVGLIFWTRSHPRTVSFMPTGTLQGIPGTVPDAVRTLPNGTPRTPANSVPNGASGTLIPPGPSLNPNLGTSPNRGLAPNPPGSGLADIAAREEALTQQLLRPGVLPAEVSGAVVKLDPRTQKVKLAIMQRVQAGSVDADIRAAIARAALIAAQSVFATDARYQSMSVETSIVGADGIAHPYFEADIDRTAAQRTDPSLRDEERFTNAAWATALADGTTRP